MSIIRRAGASPIQEVRVPQLLGAPAPSPLVLLPAPMAACARGAPLMQRWYAPLPKTSRCPPARQAPRVLPSPVKERTWHFLHHCHCSWPGAVGWNEMVYMALADRSCTPRLACQTAAPPKNRHAHLATTNTLAELWWQWWGLR